MTYIDTSFLVSLYSADANSSLAVAAMEQASGQLAVSSLAELEAVNALELRVFRKEISRRQAEASLRALNGDMRSGAFFRKPLPESAFERARKLSRRNTAQMGTRTADLLHVAAALELRASVFFSFDLRQRRVAAENGIEVRPEPLTA